MIKKVLVYAPNTGALELELSNPYSTGIAISSITGLGPNKADVSMTKLASGSGSIFGNAVVSSRNIVFNFILVEDPETNMIEDSRLRVYKYFPLMERVYVSIYTDNREVQIEGYVESVEPDIFNEKETVQVSLICPNPWFEGKVHKTKSVTEVIPYEGDVDSGFMWTIIFQETGICKNIILEKDGKRAILDVKALAAKSSKVLELPANIYTRKFAFVEYYNDIWYGTDYNIFFGISHDETTSTKYTNNGNRNYKTEIGCLERPANVINRRQMTEINACLCTNISWNGLNAPMGDCIWTDGNNTYYSDGDSHYVLNTSTLTWASKTWTGWDLFSASDIWSDGEHIYCSSGTYSQYVLDPSTSTWTAKTWNGSIPDYGSCVWTDGDNVYYSYDYKQYVLDKDTSTWSDMTWNGFSSIYGYRIWTNGENVYYSEDTVQYVLNKSTSTWVPKTWVGLTDFDGSFIWKHDGEIHYSLNSQQFVLLNDETTWVHNDGAERIKQGKFIWTDGIDTFYSDYYNNLRIWAQSSIPDTRYSAMVKFRNWSHFQCYSEYANASFIVYDSDVDSGSRNVIGRLSLGDFIKTDSSYNSQTCYKISEPTFNGQYGYISKSLIRDIRNYTEEFDRDGANTMHIAWGIKDISNQDSSTQYVDIIKTWSNIRSRNICRIPNTSDPYYCVWNDALYTSHRGQLISVCPGAGGIVDRIYSTSIGKTTATMIAHKFRDTSGNYINVSWLGDTVLTSNRDQSRIYIIGVRFDGTKTYYIKGGVPYNIYYESPPSTDTYLVATPGPDIPYDPGQGFAVTEDLNIFGGSNSTSSRKHYKCIEGYGSGDGSWEYVSTIPYDFCNGTAVWDSDHGAYFLFGGDGGYKKIYMYKDDKWTMLQASSMMANDRVDVILNDDIKKATLQRSGETHDATYAIDKASTFPKLKPGNNTFTSTKTADESSPVPSTIETIYFTDKYKGV